MNEGYCAAPSCFTHVSHVSQRLLGNEGRKADRKEKSEQVHVSQLKRIHFCWCIVEMLCTTGELFVV